MFSITCLCSMPWLAAVPVGPTPAMQTRFDLLSDIGSAHWVLLNTHKLTCVQVQTIGFLSHLREKNIYGPFMVVGPLSTLSNWVDEFRRWLPSMNVILYHGSKDERQKLRTKHMPHGMICTSAASMHDTTTCLYAHFTPSTKRVAFAHNMAFNCHMPADLFKLRSKAWSVCCMASSQCASWQAVIATLHSGFVHAATQHGPRNTPSSPMQVSAGPATDKFPVVVTSYEIVIADSKLLQRYKWKYVVVDEGHRLKNFNCKLLRELRQIPVDNKLLLTGVTCSLHSSAVTISVTAWTHERRLVSLFTKLLRDTNISLLL